MPLEIVDDVGWRKLDSARATPTWGQPARLERVSDRISLLDEINDNETDILFRRPSADPERLARLRSLLGSTQHAVNHFGHEQADWPDWLGMVQAGGLSKWDPFVRFTLELPVVDERFTSVLLDAGIDQGWRAQAIPLFDKCWYPVDSHQAFIVPAHVSPGFAPGLERNEVAVNADVLPNASAPPFAWVVDTRVLLASPKAAAALATAQLPGLTLEPVRGVRGSAS